MFSSNCLPVLYLVSISLLSQASDVLDETAFGPGKNSAVVSFKGGNTPALEKINALYFYSQAEKTEALISALKYLAETAQRPIIHYLRSQYVHSETFWGPNVLIIEEATIAQLITVSHFPQVYRIGGLPNITSDSIDESNDNGTTVSARAAEPSCFDAGIPTPWNIRVIRAPIVWERLKVTGKNVVVGVISTGVNFTHQALRANWRRESGWLDPVTKNRTNVPIDNNGLGTHVTGTIAGRNNIGVAPDAKWIACRAGLAGSSSLQNLLTCFQWVLCPTGPQGRIQNCSAAPHIVYSSWSSPSGEDTYFNGIVAMWKSVGIHHTFKIGNQGPRCSTTVAPGNQQVAFSVGGISEDLEPAPRSSRGPPPRGSSNNTQQTKPDVSAPGEFVCSAGARTNTRYISMSGTEQAAAHVAGTLALMISAVSMNPALTPDLAINIIQNTTMKNLTFPATRTLCDGNRPRKSFPNNEFGYGLIQCFDAVSRTISTIR